MNFEEMLETRDARLTTKVRLPYGNFCKRLIDGKYSNFVEFRDEVADHVAFGRCVQKEAEAIGKLNDKHQLHYTPNEGGDGVYAIAVEAGNFITFEQLLNENPAIVAQNDFIHQTIHDLVEVVEKLHEQEIYHVCFAPTNVLARKNDSSVRLLCHGSYYMALDQMELYEGLEDFVAPEVLRDSKADVRSDVYSMAKFVEWLYSSSGLPLELKKVIAKATAENPDERYATMADFYHTIQNYKNMRRTGTVALAATAVALIIVGLFFYLLPSPENIEFVTPVKDPIPEDLMEDDGALFGIGADADSATIAEIVKRQKYLKDSLGIDEKKMREFNAKAEQIFRKQFTKEADAILSKVYNNDNMNMSEKDFMVRSQSMTEELAKKQAELARSSNLDIDRANGIASKIIEQLTTKKMQSMEKDYMGIKKKKSEEEVDLKAGAAAAQKENNNN